MILPDRAWKEREGLVHLLDALGAKEGAVRFVGGMVRDTLLGLPVADIDCATTLLPEEVMRRVTEAGFKAIPTGITHGTVTAVLQGRPIEITTLRRDVSTDGRRATVAFSSDWQEDAARRDFTINALSADPADGTIHDYFGGLDDLQARCVRFIGDPLQRIAEDHLRILRFFRFQARFGGPYPDAAALAACSERAKDLMTLSRERIADEVLKLLALPNPLAVVTLMIGQGIFAPVLPEITNSTRLEQLIHRESEAGEAPLAIRRLASLLPSDPAIAEAVGARLKLSNVSRKRLISAAAAMDIGSSPRALAYKVGIDAAIDQLLLSDSFSAEAVCDLRSWSPPRLPIGGGALVEMGLRQGPAVAAALGSVERQWIAENFPEKERVNVIAREVVDQALSD